MKSNVTVELDDSQLFDIERGHDILIEIDTFAKEKDSKGGLFRKLNVTVIVRRKSGI